ARKADPGTSLAAIEAERLTFGGAAMAGETSNERRRIRYRMVRLADSPDEILGQEIGRLDEGDEVELLERSGLYWKVRTPRGEIGWVHKMTLGDVVSTTPATMDDDDDSDVLAAFNEAQAMRAVHASEPVLGEGLAARFIRERGTN
ncbi:MAG TPA: SH3 domain-containing protein, partial [Candidatus Saccharimonadia bacterium]|nr:SH3 domain-containing protein [Candidatus Saccharimonadia bacterium]